MSTPKKEALREEDPKGFCKLIKQLRTQTTLE
jgi:hypothetical protein